VQRAAPFGRLGPRKTIVLSPLDLHPVIRIAHRRVGALNISDRILLDHEFVLTLRGQGDFTLGQQTYPFRPHQLFFVRPFQRNRITTSSGETDEHIAVHFDFAPNLPPATRSLGDRLPYEVAFTQGLELPEQMMLAAGDPIEQMFIELLRARSSGEVLGQTEAARQLAGILLLLFKRQTSAGETTGARTQVLLQRAVAYAEAHFAEKLGAEDLAAAAGLSPSHFNRLFRQWSGHSPAEYLRRLRIEKARQLLADVDLSIKQIAARTGFDDAYHFSKVFRRIDGLPPTRYRQNLLAGR
jgi:AraC-like DNA-binding protein